MERNNLFFPFLLIGAGAVWLMVSLGTLPSENLWALTHIWPYLLIMAGIGLIVSNYWHSGGVVVSALTVLGMVAAVIYAPQLGWNDVSFWDMSIDYRGGGERGSGDVTSETRDLAFFDEITLDYPAEFTIRQGDEASITIEAEDNLIPQLETKVSGDRLTIRSGERHWQERVNPTQPVVIEITVVALAEISFPSAGQLNLEGLQTDQFTLRLGGAGDINIHDLDAVDFHATISGAGSVEADGQVQSLEVDIDGFGDFDSEGLASQSADVSINGAGSATVRVSETLTARINGAGSISYYGSPSVNESVNGLGDISRRGD